MKTLAIKELLKEYRIELDYPDFDDEFEIFNMLAIRGQLIDRLEVLTEIELNEFSILEIGFVEIASKIKGFEDRIMLQNSELYMKTKKLAA